MIRVEAGDMLEVVPRLVGEGVRVDAIVTDPPYDLTELQASSGRQMFVSAERPRDADRRAARKGFMGKSWDGTGIAFRPDTWATVYEILRPGGFLLAFGGTRTSHRMVCAIEDAGFVIQDTVLWLYGSGFPKHKSHLKPSVEPICLAYKPGAKRALGVDECRIPTDAAHDDPRLGGRGDWATDKAAKHVYNGGFAGDRIKSSSLGRWPANVIHDGSDEVMEAFAAYGEKPVGAGVFKRQSGSDRDGNTGPCYGKDNRPSGTPMSCFGDTGTAARFFYSAKADADDRFGSRHPTVKPIDLISYLVKLVTPPGGTFLDCFAGSGTAAVAALATGRNAILIEQDEGYVKDIHSRIAFYEGRGRHSTVEKNRGRREEVGTLL